MEIFGIVCAVIIAVIVVLGIIVYVYARGLGMPSFLKRSKNDY